MKKTGEWDSVTKNDNDSLTSQNPWIEYDLNSSFDQNLIVVQLFENSHLFELCLKNEDSSYWPDIEDKYLDI